VKVEGSHVIAAPRSVVWPMMRDPEVLAKILPGCESLEQVGDDRYEGALMIKIGPVQGTFAGSIELSDIQEPESASVAVSGQGAPGFVSGTGQFWLDEAGDTAVLRYEGDAQIGGRLAAVGQRLLDSSAKAIIKAGLDGLDAQVAARNEPEFEDAASPADTAQDEPARSHGAFAADVARHMVRDAFSGEGGKKRRFGVIAGVGLLVLLVGRLWRRMRGS